jgi:DNA-binding FrmR family transcriptional regulator
MEKEEEDGRMNYTDSMKNRLRRIEGQVRGVYGMMEQGKSCKEVVNQLTAIRAAVDSVIMYVIGENMEQCIREEVTSGRSAEKVIQEAIDLLMKSR